MNKLMLMNLIFLINFFFAAPSKGESMRVFDTTTLSLARDNYPEGGQGRFFVTGAFVTTDTFLFSSIMGVMIKTRGSQDWKMFLGREDWSGNWWQDFETAKKKNALFFPGRIWSAGDSDGYVVYDFHLHKPYLVELRSDSSITTKLLDPDIKSNITSISVNGNFMFYGILSSYHDTILSVSSSDGSDYRHIFACPPGLKRMLDSLWADPYCFPAFNPTDSTIWLAFKYYNYIYIINLNGQLLDSVAVTSSDFRMPQPPHSRMKSDAVFQEWISQCTPVKSFWYVSPGYFLLQYRSGWKKAASDSIYLLSTQAWSADRQPVELYIDKNWQFVGVQPDGRIIFAEYVIKDERLTGIVLNVVRIEP